MKICLLKAGTIAGMGAVSTAPETQPAWVVLWDERPQP